MTLRLVAFLVTSALLAHPTAARAQADESRFELELEAGAVWQSRNDVQIPNDSSATRFALDDVLGGGAWPAARVTFTWNVRDRHSVRFLAAPLEVDETGTLDQTTNFAGATFAAGLPTEAKYQFNSWRVGYRYRVLHNDRWTLRAGFTAKIRDAEVALEQPGISARDTDTGFVPLGHFSGVYRFSDRWNFVWDLDALAGGPGRAADLSLKLAYEVTPRLTISGGYRTLEGGADVDDVYNFAWLHYGVVSTTFRF